MGGRRSRRALCSTARPAGDDLGDYDDDHGGEGGEADADDNDKGLTYNGQ